MYIINKRGPKMLPWGIPLNTSYHEERLPLTVTLNCLLCRKSVIHEIILLWIPYDRQTDKTDDMRSHDRAMHYSASRGKNLKTCRLKSGILVASVDAWTLANLLHTSCSSLLHNTHYRRYVILINFYVYLYFLSVSFHYVFSYFSESFSEIFEVLY